MNISITDMTPDQVNRFHVALAILKEIMLERSADAITTVVDDRSTGTVIHFQMSHPHLCQPAIFRPNRETR